MKKLCSFFSKPCTFIAIIELFCRRGEQWRKNRSKLGKQLLPANVLRYCPGFNKISDRMIRNIQDTQDEDGYVEDMRKLVSYWSLESRLIPLRCTDVNVFGFYIDGAQFVLGDDNIDFRNDPQQHAKALQDAGSDFMASMDAFIKSPPLYKIYPTSTLNRVNNALDRMYEIGHMCIDSHIERVRECSGKKKAHGTSLLEQWLIDGNMTEQEAVKTAIGTLAAGTDNVRYHIHINILLIQISHTTAFMLYELAKHQDIQQKLYDQVTSVLGKTKEADSESLQKMPYLGHVIKETLSRVYRSNNIFHY